MAMEQRAFVFKKPAIRGPKNKQSKPVITAYKARCPRNTGIVSAMECGSRDPFKHYHVWICFMQTILKTAQPVQSHFSSTSGA